MKPSAARPTAFLDKNEMNSKISFIALIFFALSLGIGSTQAAPDDKLEQGFLINSPELVSEAIEEGLWLNQPRANGNYPLHDACRQNCDRAILMTLINAGANVEQKDDNGRTAIFFALNKEAKAENIKQLIDYGADINLRSQDGQTPLSLALRNHLPLEIIELLINGGADANRPIPYKDRKVYPLTIAVMTNTEDNIISLLLSKSNQDAVFQALTAESLSASSRLSTMIAEIEE